MKTSEVPLSGLVWRCKFTHKQKEIFLFVNAAERRIGCSPKDVSDKRQHWTTAARSFGASMLHDGKIYWHFFCHFLFKSVDQNKSVAWVLQMVWVYLTRREREREGAAEGGRTYEGEQQGSQAGVKYVEKLWRQTTCQRWQEYSQCVLG